MSHLSHWAEVADRYSAVPEFMEWLCEYGLELDFERAKPGTPLELRRLIDQYFEVDRRALDDERRELLAAATGERER